MSSLKTPFLPLVLATVILTPSLTAAPDKIKKPLTPRQVMEHLEGPIFSLVLPFDAEGNVDHGAIRKMISNAMKHGVRIFNMTGGNTKYAWISYDEVKAVTRTFVEAVGDHGISIVCTDNFWNSRLIDYLRYAEGLGADAVEVLAPRMPEEDIVEYFRTAAANTRMALSVKNVGLKDKTWRKLLEIDSVVAMKEHDIREYIFLEAKFADRLRVYSGGSIYRFLAAAPYGAKTYFDIYAIIAPWIAKEFWEAYQAGNLEKCYEMSKKYDVPIIEKFSVPFFHGALEHFGLAKRHLRAPMKSYTDEQMQEVKAFFESLGLQPRE